MELDIIGVNADGDGIAEFEGRGIAVPGTIPGERVEARLVRARPVPPPRSCASSRRRHTASRPGAGTSGRAAGARGSTSRTTSSCG